MTTLKTMAALAVLGLFVTPVAPCQTFNTIYNFCSQPGCPDGQGLRGGMVQGTNGNLFGATTDGGAASLGTVFTITRTGQFKSLLSFNGANGAYPYAGLTLASNGIFYGTTESGGANNYGSVFKMTTAGALQTLHSFDFFADGANPFAALSLGNNGLFYGTTLYGGFGNIGTIFNLTPSGTLTTLYQFGSNGAFGSLPGASPIQGTDGNFYGTAVVGGAYGSGVVYKMTPNKRVTVIYSFCAQTGCPDGASPNAGLIQGADGNFYGTTYQGGGGTACGFGCGTVFKITPSGTLTTLHIFTGPDGGAPWSGSLLAASDGNFYGNTSEGGSSNACAFGCGTIFQITPGGTLTTLHNFSLSDGEYPAGALFQGTNGTLFGTAGGGTYGAGTVFRLSMGLGPLVETVPVGGKAGARVLILGSNLTGTTSVSFNGTPATFTVNSATLITTSVPPGAASGTVQVVTPSGTLSSPVAFMVVP